MQVIEAACERLALHHKEHMAVYDVRNGQDNARRLSGSRACPH